MTLGAFSQQNAPVPGPTPSHCGRQRATQSPVVAPPRMPTPACGTIFNSSKEVTVRG